MSQALQPPADAAIRDQATRSRESWILRAPAGSGKTTLLVGRYLELLSRVDKPEEILAITFTRKATAEMRERILSSLANPQSGRPPALAEAAERARQRSLDKRWEIIANPSRLKIQTIDSFRRSLVEAAPVEAGIAPGTELVISAEHWYEEAIERVFRLLKSGDERTTCLAELLHLEGHRGSKVKRTLVTMLAKRDQWHGKLALHELDATPKGESPRWLSERMDALWALFSAHMSTDDLAQLIGLGAGRTHSAFLYQPASWRILAELCLTKAGGPRKYPHSDLVRAPDECVERLFTAMSTWTDKDIQRLHAARLFPDIRPLKGETERMTTILACLDLAHQELLALFRERGAIDLLELGFGATRALGDDELPSDLIIALDYSIKHILVDEFQDTSVTQTDFLHSLMREWTPGDGRSFFAVGDPMQSIYGFREAEVGLFSLAQQEGVGRIVAAGWRTIKLHAASLKTNFRSDVRLVEWVNRVFPAAMGDENDLPTGSVRFEPAVATHHLTPADAHLGAETHFFAAANGVSSDLSEETAFIASYVGRLLQRHDTDQIAILMRNRTYSSVLLRALREHRIAYHGNELDPLADEPVVQDLLALSRALASPCDKLAHYALLRGPIVGLSLNSLRHLSELQRQGMRLADALHDTGFQGRLTHIEREGLARLLPLLQSLHKDYHRHWPRPLIERAWALTGFAALYSDARSRSSVAATLALIEEQYVGWIDFPALERELATLYAPCTPASSKPRLTIMTIHQVKGLEFDHVLLPFVTKPTRSDERPSLRWRQSQEGLLAATRHGSEDPGSIYTWLEYEHKARILNESKRLLYVAVTRAKKSLCLTGTFREGSIKEVDGTPVLGNKVCPRADSLIAPIWECIQQEAEIHPGRPGGTSRPAKPIPTKHALTRLASGFTAQPEFELPVLQVADALNLPGEDSAQAHRQEQQQEEAPSQSILGAWKARKSIAVGTVAHEGLRWLSAHPGEGDVHERIEAIRPLLVAWLKRSGLEDKSRTSALGQVIQHLVRTLHHPQGAWILKPRTSGESESAFSLVIDNRLANLRVDRTFVEDGIRYIIDYKTATPRRKESRADFCARQIREHEAQLGRYQAVFAALDKKPIVTALFLTSLPELVEVPLPHGTLAHGTLAHGTP